MPGDMRTSSTTTIHNTVTGKGWKQCHRGVCHSIQRQMLQLAGVGSNATRGPAIQSQDGLCDHPRGCERGAARACRGVCGENDGLSSEAYAVTMDGWQQSDCGAAGAAEMYAARMIVGMFFANKKQTHFSAPAAL
eukprot:1160880-Pelagomonas_calceolata.AAC.7